MVVEEEAVMVIVEDTTVDRRLPMAIEAVVAGIEIAEVLHRRHRDRMEVVV
jgi:hypothetical protein